MRRLGSRILFLCAAGAALAAAGDPPVTRQDDAYHFASFADGRHDGLFAEWWYFNLVDAEQGVQAIFAYSVVDPAGRTGSALSSVLAVAYVPGGPFQQGAYLPPSAFAASAEEADVAVGEGHASEGHVEVIDDGRYRITGTADGEHHIAWDLVYERRSASWFAADRRPVGRFAWELMSWLVYMPSASVTGTFSVDGRTFEVRGALGYHDHNWGEWIPGVVTWNWAQYADDHVRIDLGDFPRVTEGVVGVDLDGRRTVFVKPQYQVTHSAWRFDAVYKRFFPTRTHVAAESDTTILDVSFHALDTVPIVPPLRSPALPLVYEQTADITGKLWRKTASGERVLVASFAGIGFKEYTSLTFVTPP